MPACCIVVSAEGCNNNRRRLLPLHGSAFLGRYKEPPQPKWAPEQVALSDKRNFSAGLESNPRL
jgi:hypothetical protein